MKSSEATKKCKAMYFLPYLGLSNENREILKIQEPLERNFFEVWK